MPDTTLVVYYTDPVTPGGVAQQTIPVYHKEAPDMVTAILKQGLCFGSSKEEWVIPWHMIRGIRTVPGVKAPPHR